MPTRRRRPRALPMGKNLRFGENPDVFLAALGNVAKARGIAQLAKDTGLSRESLYKTFASGTKPRFETILKISKALGVPLGIQSSSTEVHA